MSYLRNTFNVQKQLGKGAYSSVYKVKRYSDGEIYAMKKVKLPRLTQKGLIDN